MHRIRKTSIELLQRGATAFRGSFYRQIELEALNYEPIFPIVSKTNKHA